MKQALHLAFFSLLMTCCSGQQAFVENQYSEFEQHENGLIYSENTINQLKFIVDSFNVKFRSCEPSQTYLSLPHSKANYIRATGKQARLIKAALNKQTSFDSLLKKFSNLEILSNVVVVQFVSEKSEEKNINLFSLPSEASREIYLKNTGNIRNVKGQWVFEYQKKTDYTDESIEAFYFLENFIQTPMPEKYARMIQYTDCMIDTTTGIYTNARYNYELRLDENSGLKKLNLLLDSLFPYPEYNVENDNDEYYTKWRDTVKACHALRLKATDSMYRFDTGFSSFFDGVYDEVRKTGNSSDFFENMVAQLISPKEALQLKRRRRVAGMCSQDRSPRDHAFNIAILSATSLSWEVFLRAHLDIMNDRFERVSDGSYAWAGRKTYLKELEILGIDVQSLLLGICFRIDNSSPNHYFGSISRLGRALAESTEKEGLQAAMLEMIANPQLDPYNRTLIYYLFRNYNHFLEDKTLQAANTLLLHQTVANASDKLLLEMGLNQSEEKE